MKPLIMTLAVSCVAALVAVTWALCWVSSWIVGHDHVWGQMDAEGAGFEHDVAEAFHQARWLYFPAVATVIGITFLFLLWCALFKPAKKDRPYDITLAGIGVVASLVGITWALCRVSSWIVAHDHIWAEMASDGAHFQHSAVEIFNHARWLYLPAIEAIIGGVFLVLLRRTLSKPAGVNEPHDVA